MWVIPIALVFMGLLMMFFGREMWKVITGLGGALLGFYIAYAYVIKYLSVYIIKYGIPPSLIELIFAVIVGVVLIILVRLGVSGGLGYAGYYFAIHQTFHPLTLYESIAVGVVVFGIAFWTYGKISVLIAGALGAIAMYMGLIHYIHPGYVMWIVGITLTVGLIYQFRRGLLKRELAKIRHDRRPDVREARKKERDDRRKAKINAKLKRIREKTMRLREQKADMGVKKDAGKQA